MPPIALMAAAIAGTAALVTGAMNYWQQRKNQKWQKKAQYISWEREDMGVQRRVADLRAAGLSPVLAAGSAAPSGPIATTTAPQIEQEPVQAALQAVTMATNIAQTQAQTELIQAQKSKTTAEARITKKDADNYDATGISPNSSPVGKIFRDIFSGANSQTGQGVSGFFKGAIMEQLKKQTEIQTKPIIKRDEIKKEMYNPTKYDYTQPKQEGPKPRAGASRTW